MDTADLVSILVCVLFTAVMCFIAALEPTEFSERGRYRRNMKTLVVRVRDDGFSMGVVRLRDERQLSSAHNLMVVCDNQQLEFLTSKHTADTRADVVATSLCHVTNEQFSQWPRPTESTKWVVFVGHDATAYHVGVRMRSHWPNVAFSYVRIQHTGHAIP